MKVVVAVDEDKEVKRGLEEGFIIHRRSIYTCYNKDRDMVVEED